MSDPVIRIPRWERGPDGFLRKANAQLSTIEEMVRAPRPPQQVITPPKPANLLAKITALGANPTEYKASQVLPDGNSPSNPRVWDGEEGNFPVLNLIAGPHPNIGDIVRVHPGTDSSGQPFWWFLSASPVVFPVKVVKDGGVDGTGVTTATWTYTVKTLGNETLATEKSLDRPRPKGKMTSQESGYGLAFYDGTSLLLWDAGEVPATDVCE